MSQVVSDQPEIELLDGREYPKVSPRRTHALVQTRVAMILVRLMQASGEVGTEWRFRLREGTAFVPDVAYVSRERLHALSVSQREEPPFAPDIAVEVRSPSNRVAYDAQKFRAYVEHGSRLVLDVDPATRSVTAHGPDATSRSYDETEQFEHPAIPGLQFAVAELFQDLGPPTIDPRG